LFFRRLSPIFQGMIERWIEQRLLAALAQAPAVLLIGPRQVGKTTLARKIGARLRAVYLDLESPEDQLKVSDPLAFFRIHADQLVILDEIHHAPELFAVLRGVIDRNRAQGRRFGQFLLLGSASMDLLRQSSESLAGRLRIVEMSGLHLLEVGQDLETRNRLWLRGGFPESFLAPNEDAAMQWLEDLIRTYLARDVPQFGFRVPAARLRRLWTMLAHLQGEPINYARLGASLGIDGKTVAHYIDILEALLLIRRLAPWHANVKKRLVKSPRCYIRDNGILHRLLGIETFDALLGHPVAGKSWEGFVVENLLAVLPPRAEAWYYRTASGAEIDLVLQLPLGEVWAIEIKFGLAPKMGKHFRRACDDVGARRRFIVYSGDDEFPVKDGVTMISLPRLMQMLQRA